MANRLKELYDELRIVSGRSPVGSSDDAFTLKVFQLVLDCAAQAKASDIHIEPNRADTRIRFRIDGMLHEVLRIPLEISEPLVRSIKIRANLATEPIGRSKPQDGRIDIQADNRRLDLRLSSYPTLYGDVLAIRVLDRSASLRNLDEIGCAPGMLKSFQSMVRSPNGLVLVAGPGGSGKTTTLYAALNILRSSEIKVVTLEDPIEYQVDGVDQGQVNTALGLTFAAGLRAALRQDANVILVGEIRDRETAEIVIRAALTGHMVLSTIHTRHSLGTIIRLLDMGIELHMILASLVGSMAQRLVRVVCPHCAKPDALSQQVAEKLWLQECGSAASPGSFSQFRKGAGCERCNNTGYQGRVGIFELLTVTEDFRRILFENPISRIYNVAKTSGELRTMLMDGLEKAGRGVTTLQEVLRVTGEVEDVER